MKVLMLNPPYLRKYSRQSRSPCVTKGGTFYYPYFAAYATGMLEKAGFDVRLIDAVAREWSHDQTAEYARRFNPALVVIDTSTPSIKNDVMVAERIRKELPDAHITLVGTHPTYLPAETLGMSKSIDSVCRDEYDFTLPDLASALQSGKPLSKVSGISYRNGSRIAGNPNRERAKDIDSIPFVSGVYKRHLDVRDYFYSSLLYPQVTILTARGCPFNCSFCNSPFKASYRPRSPKNVVDEFEYIQRELPHIREVMIEDETFPVDKERTLEICRLMKERGIRLKWSCNARVDTDLETMMAMKSAGCRLMCVGFESPRQEVLNGIHKGTTTAMQLEFMADTKKVGLLVNGCFILGLPNDTNESIMETVEFAKKLNPDTAQFYPIMVYPGLEAYAWAKRNGYLTTEDYSKWLTSEGLHSTTVSRPGMSDQELLDHCDRARREFYIRPSYMARKALQSIKSLHELKRNLKSSRTFFRHVIRRKGGRK